MKVTLSQDPHGHSPTQSRKIPFLCGKFPLTPPSPPPHKYTEIVGLYACTYDLEETAKIQSRFHTGCQPPDIDENVTFSDSRSPDILKL